MAVFLYHSKNRVYSSYIVLPLPWKQMEKNCNLEIKWNGLYGTTDQIKGKGWCGMGNW